MATKATPYFWLMTVQVVTRTELSVMTRHGVLNVSPGETRTDTYLHVCELVARNINRSDFTVTYFQLEPNQL